MIRRLTVLLTVIGTAAWLGLAELPASAAPHIPGGTYAFSNYEQYFTNLNGDLAHAGDEIVFTPGIGDGDDSTWQLKSHGTVTSSGSTFTPGSGLNADFDGSTIWELYNPGPDLDAGGCPSGDWDHTCLNNPPSNFWVIRSISGSDYYLVNVHASNEAYGETGLANEPYLLCYQTSYYRGLFREWDMSGSRPEGSTITAHQLP